MAANLSLVEAQPSLSDRIAAALTEATTSGAVSNLMRDVDAELSATAARMSRVEVRALDPLTPADEVEQAQADLISTTFAQKRLKAARERLDARFKAVKRSEDEAEARRVHDAVKAELDACADLLRSRYVALCTELVEIVERCERADAERRNRKIYDLHRPEFLAFGLSHNYDQSMLASMLRLPDLTATGRVFWPKP
ncbi:hypothetical protein [Methylobacterium aquaticum]|uniref:Uncharacterized protein n=1 Tax=Methylobacterium aquaticum TaxID=270351 RepID=A0A0J6V4P6_9HYPH|nr:hypothetical protein [Methylobacterium aquaticum]KMO33871.1 hypothetical protein VP06_15565 [Methylobacterium aquaticum]